MNQALAGDMEDCHFVRPVEVRTETPEAHRRCHLCA